MSEFWGEEIEGPLNCIIPVLERKGVLVVKREWRSKFYDFLSDCHEKGVIRPMTDKEFEERKKKDEKFYKDCCAYLKVKERIKNANKQDKTV